MSVRQAIHDWSETQPAWRRDLLRRVAVGDADEQACLEVFDLLLGEHGLAPAALAATPLSIADLPDDAPLTPAVLYEIGDCKNVNAIESREPLTFESKGITLVYGPNGVGKSSYSRIIKRIAHSASEEAVLPNVFASTSAPPRAVIDLEDANGRRKHIVPLADGGPALLDSTIVFDGRCANVYLRSEKTVGFTPTPLRVFARAAAAQLRIRELLDGRIATLAARRPALEPFKGGTRVRLALDGLTGRSSFDDLTELAKVTDDELEDLAQARLELAAVDAGANESQARRHDRDAEALDALATELDAAATSLSPEVEVHLAELRQSVKNAESAAAFARSTILAEEGPVPAGDGWLRMWDAVRSFVEEDCQHPFPPIGPGARCPFCEQELSEGSRNRLHRLDEFVRSTLKDELEASHRTLEESLASITRDALDRAGSSEGMRLLKDHEALLEAKVNEWLAVAGERCSALRAGIEPPPLPSSRAKTVRAFAAKRREEAAHQRSLIKPREQETLRQKVAEAEARIQLRDRLTEFQDWHVTMQTIEALGDVRKQLATARLRTRITMSS
jgi:energy-coupling factor transporter ATP-binding protein EcfA2